MIKVCPRCGHPQLKEYTMSPMCYEPSYIPEVQCQRCCYICTREELLNGTVFNVITQSPEVLAEKLVFSEHWTITSESPEKGKEYEYWSSPFIDMLYSTKAEAIAATVAKLKEVGE